MRGRAEIVRVAGLRKRYSEGSAAALEGVTVDVAGGEYLTIVGASGCGKTTLLRLLCGLVAPTAGTVSFGGRIVSSPPREFALVFQDYRRSLFPWLTVLRNVMFPLRGAGLSRAERIERAENALEEVGLHDVSNDHPWRLSGGQQQRVAIARALVSRPAVMLLDEPFASVDALTRAELQDLVLRVHGDLERDVTFVHVTHDIDEAVYLADRVLVLGGRPGRLVGEVAVDLPRPRVQRTTRSLPRFLALRNQIHDTIASKEVLP